MFKCSVYIEFVILFVQKKGLSAKNVEAASLKFERNRERFCGKKNGRFIGRNKLRPLTSFVGYGTYKMAAVASSDSPTPTFSMGDLDSDGTKNGAPSISFSIEVDESSFAALEAEIKEVLEELAQDKAMNAFRGEYEKLFGALQKSFANERALSIKCRDLVTEIARQRTKRADAREQSEADKEAVGSLRSEMAKAWKAVDDTAEREDRARETIEDLNLEIQNLTNLYEEKMMESQDSNLNELRKSRDELLGLRESLKGEVRDLKGKTAAAEKKIAELNKDIGVLKRDNTVTKNALSVKTSELNRETRRKERLEREAKELRSKIEEQEEAIGHLEIKLHTAEDNATKLEGALVAQRDLNDQLGSKLESVKSNLVHVNADLDAQVASAKDLSAAVEARDRELEVGKEWNKKLVQDAAVQARAIERLEKSLSEKTEIILKLERDQIAKKEELLKRKKQLSNFEHESKVAARRLTEKEGELSAASMKINRAAENTRKQESATQDLKLQLSEANSYIQRLEREGDSLRVLIGRAEGDRDRNRNVKAAKKCSPLDN